MLRRTQRSDAILIAAAAILAIAGMFIVRHGESFGWWLLLACTAAAAVVALKPFLPAGDLTSDDESLEISPWGVRRYEAGRVHEAVSWADLSEVAVVTTQDGDEAEDVYLVLKGRGNAGLIVPHTLAVESGILSELHLRLSEFDSQAFVDALASTADQVFVLWRAPTPVSPLHASARPQAPAQPLRAAS